MITARQAGWGITTVLALLTALLISRYLTFDPAVFFPEQRATYEAHRFSLYLHILGAMVALVLGPFQFSPGLRKRFLKGHRIVGRLYLLGCLAGGIGGLSMTRFAHGGFPAGMGFAMLGALWLIASAMALHRIRQRNVAAHREWMIRSFALTFAAPMLRLYLTLHGILSGMEIIDLPFTQAYIAIAWLCWVPNVLFAEWFINATRPQPVTNAL